VGDISSNSKMSQEPTPIPEGRKYLKDLMGGGAKNRRPHRERKRFQRQTVAFNRIILYRKRKKRTSGEQRGAELDLNEEQTGKEKKKKKKKKKKK